MFHLQLQEFPYKTLLELVVWHRTEDSGSIKKRQLSNESQQPSRADRNLTNPIGSSVMPKEASGIDDSTAGFSHQKSNLSGYAHGFSFGKDLLFQQITSTLKYITEQCSLHYIVVYYKCHFQAV